MKKVVHLADLHLGAKLHGKDRGDEQRLVLEWVCKLLEEERPDALVLAGDLFDMYYPPAGAQRDWFDFLARVRGERLAGCVVAVAGNHDSPSALGCSGRVLELIGTRLAAGEPSGGGDEATGEAFAVECADGGRLGFAAIPFLREGYLRTRGDGDAREGFARHARAVLEAAGREARGGPVVAVAHCTVEGGRTSDEVSERGRRFAAAGGVEAVGAEAFDGADYAALGHLHLPQRVGGREWMRYAGAPLAMSFAEAGKGGKRALVAEFEGGAGEEVRVREVGVPVFRELRGFAGSREEILEAAAGWKPEARAAGGAWAAVSVTKGEGSFSRICEEARAVLAENGAELVRNTDDRRPGGAAGPGAGGGGEASVADLQGMDAADLASERLGEVDLHLTEEERAEYMAMVREALG